MTIEIDPRLADTARENLRRAGVTNVTVETGNGLSGLAARAPFDVIVVSGAVAEVPKLLPDQTKPGGRLFAIEGAAPAMEAAISTRTDKGFQRRAVFETATALLTDAEAVPAFAF